MIDITPSGLQNMMQLSTSSRNTLFRRPYSQNLNQVKIYYFFLYQLTLWAQYYFENEGWQNPTYYTRRSMLDAEMRHLQLKKTRTRLGNDFAETKNVFSSTPIIVVTTFQLNNILLKTWYIWKVRDMGLHTWGVQISLWTLNDNQLRGSWRLPSWPTDRTRKRNVQNQPSLEYWTLLVDNSNSSKENVLGMVLISPQGEHIERAIRYGFKMTNNEAKLKKTFKWRSFA